MNQSKDPKDRPGNPSRTEGQMRNNPISPTGGERAGVVTEAEAPPDGPVLRRHRIFLDNDWFVEVDDQGSLLNPCAEGALGYVIQLQPSLLQEVPTYCALKIPRLRADTLEENANIADILSTEATNVFRAQAGGKEGLVPTKREDQLFLKGKRVLNRQIDAIEQNGCVPLIAFGKDYPVRICNVRFDPDPTASGGYRRVVFPEGADAALSFLTYAYWSAHIPTREAAGMFDYAVVFRNLSDTSEAAGSLGATSGRHTNLALKPHFELKEALGLNHKREVWYAGLPSIRFEWAYGDLQAAIGMGRTKKWSIWQQYELLKGVLSGLSTLHRKRIVHADVRPANIMALVDQGTKTRPKDPMEDEQSYRLSDYGSFGNDLAALAPTPKGSGHTTMPGVARHRVSVFYGRERRSGIEREDANIAVIIAIPVENRVKEWEYFIRLGYRKQLLSSRTNQVQPSVLEDMYKAAAELRQSEPGSIRKPKDDWNLTEKDQFRICDYVFLVKKHRAWTRQIQGLDVPQARWVAESSSDNQENTKAPCLDFICGKTHTRVLLEKIAVRSDDQLVKKPEEKSSPLPDHLLLHLPRWTEIRQTSFASDIYSVGVLALYLAFSTKSRSDSDAEMAKPDVPGAGAQKPNVKSQEASNWDAQNVEERISAIVQRLEDENSFKHLFPQLQTVCTKMGNCIEDQDSAGMLLHQEVSVPKPKPKQGAAPAPAARKNPSVTEPGIVQLSSGQATDNQNKPGSGGSDDGTVKFHEMVKNLIETTLHLSEDLKVISEYIGNYGHFLFFLHFVLSCLHRRSSPQFIDGKEQKGEEEFPFCKDRCDDDDGLAKTVQKRVETLVGYRKQTRFFNEFHTFMKAQVQLDGPILGDYAVRQQLLTVKAELSLATSSRLTAELGQRRSQEILQEAKNRLQAQQKESEDRLHAKQKESEVKLQHMQDLLLKAETHTRRDLSKLVLDSSGLIGKIFLPESLIRTLQEYAAK